MKSLSNDQVNNDKRKINKKDIIFYSILTLVVVVAILLRVFVITSYTVVGSSMEPTIKEGEWVWINKCAKPQRGDIVVAYEPLSKKALVKRVVALDGDKISLKWSKNGYILIIETPEGKVITEQYEGVDLPEILPMRTGILSTTTYMVKGGYFLMGDNRNDSNDSRNPDIGVFEYKDLIGVVIGH